MPGILNEDEEQQLPRGVTTATGKYTAGTAIASRSAPRAAVSNTRVDLPILNPAPPSTGRYTQSNVNARRSSQGLVAPPRPSSQPGKPGVSIIPAAEAKSVRTQQGAVRSPTKAMTPGFSARYFSADPPSGPRALSPAQETQNVYSLPGINRYTDASGVPTFTNKGRAGYDELQGLPQISQESLDRTLATSPLFANRSADGVSRIDPVSAGLARKAFAADQATAEAKANAADAERRILKRLPTLPAPKLGDALQGVTDLRAAKSGKVPTLDQVKAARATQLLTRNPGDLTATDQVLFGKNPPATQRRIVEDPVLGPDGFPTGAKQFYSVDPATGQAMPVDLAGGAGQGQPSASVASQATADANRAVKLGKLTRAQANERLRQAGFPEI